MGITSDISVSGYGFIINGKDLQNTTPGNRKLIIQSSKSGEGTLDNGNTGNDVFGDILTCTSDCYVFVCTETKAHPSIDSKLMAVVWHLEEHLIIVMIELNLMKKVSIVLVPYQLSISYNHKNMKKLQNYLKIFQAHGCPLILNGQLSKIIMFGTLKLG